MAKIAVVTGATGNLGKAVTKVMANAGFIVIGTIEPGKEPPPDHYEHVVYKAVDLMDANDARSLVEEVQLSYGRIDAAICLVGGFDMATLPETSHEALEKMIKLNFYTAFNTIQPILRILKDQKGRKSIVLIGAKPVFEPNVAKAVFPYALSKSMIVRMAEVINADSKLSNTTATVIVPSIIDTPPNRKAMPDADFSDWVTPDSIAEKILFICGDEGGDLRETVLKIYGNS
jgi:NAD(P)-dependent dehydrogenase (short-subunit alcohol dehydrogenase family)